MNLRKVRIVARFELVEALRSRLALVVVGFYAAGAAVGAWGFVNALAAAERAARDALADAMRVPAASLPPDLVRERALPRIAEGIEDERIREVLLSMEPLGIFYGFMALNFVALFVLLISGGTHAADLESGAARYVLFRVDRTSWALGKTAGQAALLAVGLLVGALVTGLMGLWLDDAFKMATFASLGRASLSAWLYGLAYLGLFSGVSMIAKSPLRARGLSLLVLIACAIGHSIATSDAVNDRAPPVGLLRWIFPGEYRAGLWYASAGSFAVSVIGLIAIGAAGFSLGSRALERRDA